MDEKGSIILYTTPDGESKIEVTLQNETVWLTLDQMAELFQRNKSTISRHIKNIFETGELNADSTVAFFATTCFLFNSPVSKMFLICLEMVDLLRWNNSAIWSKVNHTVSF